MRTVVWTGSRGWQDVQSIEDAILGLKRPFRSILGGADGFDTLVEETIAEFKMPRLVFRPKWRVDGKYDRGAGHARNRLMLDWLQQIDPRGFVVAGWDGASTGTLGCMQEAQRRGIDIMHIMYVPSLNEGGK